jgi:hypothetical protein
MCASRQVRKMSDEQLLELLATTEEWAGRPFTSAREIAAQSDSDISRQGARQRLEQLVDQRDEIRRYKPSRDVIYWKD